MRRFCGWRPSAARVYKGARQPVLRDAGRVCIAARHREWRRCALVALDLVAETLQRLPPTALLPNRVGSGELDGPINRVRRARSSERGEPWSAGRRPRSTPRPWSPECGWRGHPGLARRACAGLPARRSWCPSRPSAAAPRRESAPRRRPPSTRVRVRWKSVRKWSVNEGRRARSAMVAKTRSRGASISISALIGPIRSAILVLPQLRRLVRAL